jgi:hypothetical protein
VEVAEIIHEEHNGEEGRIATKVIFKKREIKNKIKKTELTRKGKVCNKEIEITGKSTLRRKNIKRERNKECGRTRSGYSTN